MKTAWIVLLLPVVTACGAQSSTPAVDATILSETAGSSAQTDIAEETGTEENMARENTSENASEYALENTSENTGAETGESHAEAGVFDFESRTVMLNSGYEMPIMGLGTYALDHDTCVNSVKTLLENG